MCDRTRLPFDKPRPSIPHDAKSQQDGKARIRRAALLPLHQQRSRLAAGNPVRSGPWQLEHSHRLGGVKSLALSVGITERRIFKAHMKFAQQMELHLLLKVGPCPSSACTLAVNANSTRFCNTDGAAILSPQLEVRRQCTHVVLDRPCFESPSLRAPAITAIPSSGSTVYLLQVNLSWKVKLC